ncbi:MAG TPA: class I SAM-dependent methyltransferase [Acidimicrobiales bacterium]|nr:class I SAM-dependent methyltransferase [Acidimicrobiales bacterium]
MTTDRPGDHWRRALRETAPPPHLADAAPERPRHLEPEMFRWRPEQDAAQPERPSRLRAREALPQGGTLLDVGVGGGGSSLGLASRAGVIVGVDRSEAMLASFLESAASEGVEARAVLGEWPDVAGEVEPADVAVCHHALYFAEEIEAFLDALTSRARRRVVVEVSAEPPPVGLRPIWRAIHGEERATRPVADDLAGVLSAMGIEAQREDVVIPPQPREVTPQLVAFARRRLLVGEDRDEEIAALLRTLPRPDHRVVAFWWDGGA